MQQQSVMEEGSAYEPPTYSYDETFPVLPESASPISSSPNPLSTKNNSMRVGCSVVTQVPCLYALDLSSICLFIQYILKFSIISYQRYFMFLWKNVNLITAISLERANQ